MCSYVIDLALLLANSLGLGLHQISHFLFERVNKLNGASNLASLFYTWGAFVKHINTFARVL